MSLNSPTIPKLPPLEPGEDFHFLRREGIGFIEQMASSLWTDYNTHDPGITILEALCYAITDLAYRIGWDIKDLLTPEAAGGEPYPKQAFFGARDILTVNPVTTDDLRRLLIDLENIRNAWVFRQECECIPSYYAWCEKERLRLSYQAPATGDALGVSPRGLYEVLLELESDPALGDLNDWKKVDYPSADHDGIRLFPITAQLRFPEISLADQEKWRSFLESAALLDISLQNFFARAANGSPIDVFGLPEKERDDAISANWRNGFSLTFKIEYSEAAAPGQDNIVFTDAALRFFVDSGQDFASWLQTHGGAGGLKSWLEDKGGFVQRYREKAKKAHDAIESAKNALFSHRNLDEDFCSVKVAGIEQIAACADVEVDPDADIEKVQAQIWFELEQCINQPVRFSTLQEMLAAKLAVEDIFNGPPLAHGFVKEEDLAFAALKSVLRVSDILNRLMDIEGVIAVNQLQLTKYDSDGNVVKGAADPSFGSDGKAVFDPAKISASWLLSISPQHLPRPYLDASRFIFYKKGLPFRAEMDEAFDTLNELRGEAERQKHVHAANDLDIPQGNFRNPEEYFPLQYGFPLAYGIGPDGLPPQASKLRMAQAKQLKAYLMAFEQVLADALAQLSHTGELFSLDPEIKRTYFVHAFSEQLIQGFDEITAGLDKSALEKISETETEFLDRRNRFLDHLLARFGEAFDEHALLIGNPAGVLLPKERLIADKISFLENYPPLSRDRAKASDCRFPGDHPPAIKSRVRLLLGDPVLEFSSTAQAKDGGKYQLDFDLQDKFGKSRLAGSWALAADSEDEAKRLGAHEIVAQMLAANNYEISLDADKFRLKFMDIALSPPMSDIEAASLQDELMRWSANERMMVVEHLLLRPKFPGDALYPVFPSDPCNTCNDADPYSFRLTFVMPGWAAPYADNLEMRRFAEGIVHQEMPSHLLGKICWLDQKSFEEFEEAQRLWLEKNAQFDWTDEHLQEAVAAIIAAKSPGTDACQAAAAILAKHGTEFQSWMEANMAAGNSFENMTAFAPGAVDSGAIDALLKNRYDAYGEVSYRLRIVVNQLGKLHNVYPVATLHDCSEGSDQNPVFLDSTALGEPPPQSPNT